MDINVYDRNPFPTVEFPDTSPGHREEVGQGADYQAVEGGNNFGPHNHLAEDKFPSDYNGWPGPDCPAGLGLDNPVGDGDPSDLDNQTDPDNRAVDPGNCSTGLDCLAGADPGGSDCLTDLADSPVGLVGRIGRPADYPAGVDLDGSGCLTDLAADLVGLADSPAGLADSPAGLAAGLAAGLVVGRIGLDNPVGADLADLEHWIGRAGR